MTGTITKWDFERGFGFVKMSNSRSLFLHITNWNSEETPLQGMVVSFEIGTDSRTGKTQAVSASPIGHPGLIALALPHQKAGA